MKYMEQGFSQYRKVGQCVLKNKKINFGWFIFISQHNLLSVRYSIPLIFLEPSKTLVSAVSTSASLPCLEPLLQKPALSSFLSVDCWGCSVFNQKLYEYIYVVACPNFDEKRQTSLCDQTWQTSSNNDLINSFSGKIWQNGRIKDDTFKKKLFGYYNSHFLDFVCIAIH